MANKSFQRQCASRTRQFVSRLFVVLLRKSFPQKTNLQTAAELSVTWGLVFCLCNPEGSQKQNRKILKNESFRLLRFGKFVRYSGLKNAKVSLNVCSCSFCS
jgi:hypothetical protein